MSFRLFGFDVEVHPGFWLVTGLIGFFAYRTDLASILVWVPVVFASILIHELGHAFAIRRHGIQPDISIHGMGGTTSWRMPLPLSRPARIFISLAGPFAGFLAGALVYALLQVAASASLDMPVLAQTAIGQLLWVNIGWGIVNLLPVLPFDGGHVLEQALGPKRVRMSAGISIGVGVVVALLFLYVGMIFAAMIFGFGALQSYQQFRAQGPDPSPARRSTRPAAVKSATSSHGPIDARSASLIQRARAALADDRTAEAVELAEQVLAGAPASDEEQGDAERKAASPLATVQALEVIAWAHLAEDRADEAGKVHAAICNLGEPDDALTGAIFFAKGQLKEARRVFEACRSKGDERKEVVGPLIQILVQQGEVARASATAFDIVDSLSTEDARRLAQIAYEGRAYDWAARLWEAMFEREREPEDAYEAARAHARDGATDRSLALLKSAVDAGFSDGARAWSDAALEVLRGDDKLGAVLPRP